ncbi:hypothetical protein [Lysobacter niastensis]|uniref:Lipoprotein n=1 Tax=Lysobacter niastensis TaxID=380629 RepID=A0ABS0B3S0_9GAMM|nr:hypothetical protein [Lysobacter niastensis]MBF6022958.1 hypothetical protein [Lysobacter niastensis]
MKIIAALFYFALSLFGCDVGRSTFVDRISTEGAADFLYSKTTVEGGVARFECLRSASGECHYTVFPRECASAASSKGKRSVLCQNEPVERFAVANGDSLQIRGLRDFRLCVSTESKTPGPECEMPRPMEAPLHAFARPLAWSSL